MRYKEMKVWSAGKNAIEKKWNVEWVYLYF